MASVMFSLSLIPLTRGGELPHHKDTQVALRRGPCGEELSPPANSYVSEPFWKQIFHFQLDLWMTAALDDNWTATSRENMRQSHPA